MRNLKFIVPILLLVSLVLIGGGCGEKTKLPEVCIDKPIPKGFPEDLLHPNVKSKEIIEIGMSDEVSGAGWDGYTATFCADVSKDEILEWYKDKLEGDGYSFYVYEEGNYIFQKDKWTIALDLDYQQIQDFTLFNIGIQIWN
jgi:hypothetical protein